MKTTAIYSNASGLEFTSFRYQQRGTADKGQRKYSVPWMSVDCRLIMIGDY